MRQKPKRRCVQTKTLGQGDSHNNNRPLPLSHRVSTVGKTSFPARRCLLTGRCRLSFQLRVPSRVLPPVIDLPAAAENPCVVVTRLLAVLQPAAEAPHRVHQHSLSFVLTAVELRPVEQSFIKAGDCDCASSPDGRKGGATERHEDEDGGDRDGNSGSGTAGSWPRPIPEDDAEAPGRWDCGFFFSSRPPPLLSVFTSLPEKHSSARTRGAFSDLLVLCSNRGCYGHMCFGCAASILGWENRRVSAFELGLHLRYLCSRPSVHGRFD